MGGRKPTISASAPAKCVLFGEHAVVYGQPAIAVALDMRTRVSIQTHDKMEIEGRTFQPKIHPHIHFLIKKLWPKSSIQERLSIDIQSEIPSASGLGSSAAMCNALIACLRTARGRRTGQNGEWLEGWSSFHNAKDAYDPSRIDGYVPHANLVGDDALSIDECGLLSHAAEAFAQGGLASPMDTSTSAHGGLILLGKSPKEQYLYTRELVVNQNIRSWDINHLQPQFPDDLFFVIGATGIRSSTKEQVEHVARLISNSGEYASCIEDIGAITMAGLDAMQKGDFVEVGRLMNQNQILLEKLQVSSTELRRLIRAALPTSLGTKLSGAGGGGCMVALTQQPEQTALAIEAAGGTSFITSVSNEGVRLESFETILNS